ncbi:hypothetical protein [Dasania marina]|uniref:hypothetical protein n=1 Tax=Dasania marina TaxID=471499 RepID=UPI0030D7D395|tara:strand:+ start:170655 stop:171149 length:495 start_codon:yes stop_codon:yes gene_type:complete
MFKNKHVITALIVTPILAVLGYFATDYLVSEQPHKAVKGGSYELVQLPNCRYASGQCELKNGNFHIRVRGSAEEGASLLLHIESEFPLNEAMVSVVNNTSDEGEPKLMQLDSDDGKAWLIRLHVDQPESQILRIVVSSEGSVYYAETAMPFLKYETSFKKDFRS